MSLTDTAKTLQLQGKDAFDALPIIDLSNIHSTDPALRTALAHKIREACLTAGFFYVKNHGVSQATIDAAYDAIQRFFNLPLEKKLAIDIRKNSNIRGYNPLFSATNDQTEGVADAHEGFEFGAEDNDHRGNVWPDEADVPGFKDAVSSYYNAAVNLGKGLFPLFALAMNLPEDYFENKTRGSAALMRLLHYPDQERGVGHDPRQMGIGAHTDWECFTILWQQPDIQALEVLNSNKQWIPAPPIPGTFVVNLGDQFARWTNDLFKSNIHRATNPRGQGRYSIPLFFGTDYDVLIEPISSCVSADNPAKYEPITAGEYVRARGQATYGHAFVGA